MKKKKILIPIISVALICAIAISVYSAYMVGVNSGKFPKFEDAIKQSETLDMGDSFLVANAKPAAVNDANAQKAFDGDNSTYWEAKSGDKAQFVFDRPTPINNITIKESGFEKYKGVRKFKIEAYNGKKWVKIYNNDLIETLHYAIFDTVKTTAIRITIDEVKGNPTAKIHDVSFSHQRPVEYDNEFVNMGYLSSNHYLHKWDNISNKTFESMTDITMIGNFIFDNKGKFVISNENTGSSNDITALYESSSSEADELFSGWKQYVESFTSTPKKYWISITALKVGPTNPFYDRDTNGGRTDAFRTPEVRAKFISDVVDFVVKYDIAGVDIDWEYPSTSAQWNDYSNLVIELSAALKAQGRLLSSAQAPGTGLSTEAVMKFDRVNIMAYDLVGATEGQHATFKSTTYDFVKDFLDRGFDKEKIILGLPWYSDKVGDATQQIQWTDIHAMLTQDNAEGDITIDEGVNEVNGWTFNGPHMIRNKVAYAATNKLGGVFCWQMKNDFDYDHQYSVAKNVDETIKDFVVQPK